MSFSHVRNSAIVPPHEQIKDDLLLAQDKLWGVHQALKRYKKSLGKDVEAVRDVPGNLEHIVKVFNENACRIYSVCTNFNFNKEFSFTFEEFKKDRKGSRVSEDDLQFQYRQDKAEAEDQYNKIMDTAYQFIQIGILYDRFLPRLDHVIEKALAQKLPVEKRPVKVAKEARLDTVRLIEPALRLPADVIKAQIKQEKNAVSSTSLKAPYVVEVSQPQPVTSVSAEIDFYSKRGVLGICHAPYWGGYPVLFKPSTSSSSNTWYGQIPVDVDFKFVIVENGKGIQWEEGLNRRLTAENPSISLNADQVKFA